MVAGRLIDKVQIPPSSEGEISILMWLPIESIQAFTKLPMATPTPRSVTVGKASTTPYH